MQIDQGFTRSHWTPPLGDYSLLIAPTAARVTINTRIMPHVPTLLGVLMAIAMRRHYTACIAQRRRFVAFIKATKRRQRSSTHSDSINRTHQSWLVWAFHREKELQLTCWPLISIYQTDEKNLNNMVEYFVGVVKLAHYCFITHFLWHAIFQ